MLAHDARWYWHRLRAMSVAEVARRAWRLARPAGRSRTTRDPASWRGPTPFYFSDDFTPVATIAEPEQGPLPFDDVRLVFESNRGHDWVILAHNYRATRNAETRARLVAALEAWHRDHPVGVGAPWSSAMEAAIRVHSLAWVAGFLHGDELLPKLATMLDDHLAFVADNLSGYSSANNHLIIELSALVVGARCFDQTDVNAASLLERELARQILPDGVDAEMATHYHAFVLEALLLVAYLERAHGTRWPRLEAVIAAMATYLEHLRCDDGHFLEQGDGDGGVIVALFRADYATRLIDHARALEKNRELSLLHRSGFAQSPRASKHFKASGQVVLRSPRLIATFDAGPFGFGPLAAHAHCDALAVNVAIDGRRFVIDRGTYRYNGDPAARDAYRMTAAHNTVQIGALEQATPAGPFLWVRRPTLQVERCSLGDDTDLVAASHDGFHPFMHRRTLLRHLDVLIVIDHVTTALAATSRYHLAPEHTAERGEHGELVIGRGWFWTSTPTRITQTRHSDRYATETLAETIECDVGASSSLVTILGPGTIASQRASIARALEIAVAQGLVPSSVRGPL